MRIPARDEFSPLPELIDLLRLPDPLAVLPQLENRLDAVADSTAQIQACVDGLRGAVGDIETAAHAVEWRGVAAGQFRSTLAELTSSLRDAAGDAESVAAEAGATAGSIRRVILIILVVLGTAAGIAALIFAFLAATGAMAVAVAATLALVLGVISLVVLAIAALLDEIEWLGQRFNDAVELVAADLRQRLDRLRDWVTGRQRPIWREPELPGRWVEPEATV